MGTTASQPAIFDTITIITVITITGLWWHGGSGKFVSSNEIMTHSGTGEREAST